jgi:beta-lactamase regulating signal transducer with metallopeptidase domain
MQPIFTCFTENLNYALGWMVIHSLWQATVIAIVSGIAVIIVRKKSATLRYWIHNAALLSVLIAAIITFCLYFDFSKELGQTVFIPEKVRAISAGNTITTNNQTQSSLPIVSESAISIEGLQMYFNRNIYLIVTIWALGVALFILKLLGGISYVYYLRSKLNFPADEYWLEMVEKLGEKAGVKRSIELVESALVRSPLVVGHLKPIILFPIGAINKLNAQEVEAILSHEIAHIMRNDYVFNIIQSVIEALFYFHPAVWWISANIRAERENCCDDVAIALCGNSMTYAKALVSLQEMAYYSSPNLAMAFAGQRKNQLLFRVQRILKQPNNKANVMEKLIATCLLLVMMVALSFGGNRWNSNSVAEFNTVADISVPPSNLTPNENILANTPTTVLTKHYLKCKVNGILDSFPVSKDITDGNYNYADNMFKAKLYVANHAVVKLTINGSEIAANEIKNHAGFINKIIMRSSETTPQYDEDNQTVAVPNHAPMPYTTVTPMPTFSESNGDMVIKNPDGSQTVISHSGDANTTQSVITTQRDGSRSVTKSYKNGQTINETFDKNGRKITSNSFGLQKINGYNNIQPAAPANNWNQAERPEMPERPESEDKTERINDLKEEMNDLKQEITDCECQTNVDFRKKLVSKISSLLNGLNKGSDASQIKIEFKNIQKAWEKGDCDDNDEPDDNGNIGYGKKKSNGTSYSGYFNNSGTGNGASISNTKSKDKKPDLMQVFFLDLVKRELVRPNVNNRVEFNNSQLRINGKVVDNAIFNSVKNNFEQYLSNKKSPYAISYSGILRNVTDTGLSIQGTLSTSVNDN